MEEQDYYTYGPFYVGITTDAEDARQKFLQLFIKLPPELRSFLLNEATTEKIVQFGTTAGLDGAGIAFLSKTVRDIVSGSVFLGDLPSMVAEKFRMGPEDARALLNGLLNEVLAPVVAQVKQVQSEAFGERLGRPKAPALRPVRPPQSVEPKLPQPQPVYPVPPPAPARPPAAAKPRQISNLGYLLQDQPSSSGPAPSNPNNVIDLRNQQK